MACCFAPVWEATRRQRPRRTSLCETKEQPRCSGASTFTRPPSRALPKMASSGTSFRIWRTIGARLTPSTLGGVGSCDARSFPRPSFSTICEDHARWASWNSTFPKWSSTTHGGDPLRTAVSRALRFGGEATHTAAVPCSYGQCVATAVSARSARVHTTPDGLRRMSRSRGWPTYASASSAAGREEP